MSAPDPAARLVAELAVPLGVEARAVDLAGGADPPPVPALLAALAVARAYSGTAMPGAEVLGAWEAFAGAPAATDAPFRILPAADGWVALTLSRPYDAQLVPALVSRDLAPGEGPWDAVTAWLAATPAAAALERAVLLGLPAAVVPDRPPAPRRPPVVVRPGGPRRRGRERPLVVDLTALWAGPLCAHLLGRAGARVVKVESSTRPDGARVGNPAYFARLHAGHEQRRIDFDRDHARLVELVRSADVVLEASRPRALRQLGLDADELADGGTIWASITAYGRDGEDGLRVGFGNDVAAAAGLTRRVAGRPAVLGYAQADPLAGVHAAAAVLVALRGGRGALLDVSMYDTAVRAANTPPPPG